MLLPRGTRLGPYEIQSTIGAGGMGEVYRARDTRLDRTVAIKILPENLTGTPELHLRFEREARAISGLNHPHICTLHDIGHQDGIDFLVMEYLEGETLAKRLERGPLSAQELSRIATEIADALDRAHRQGVIHRDLKPGNIMLTKAGTKLLDFGLAKTALAPVGGELSSSPTLSQPLTECGTLVGTLQYMSPEQLEGKEADARSDIFAFGGVLYEMATGRKAFEGNSQASVIAAILEREPPPISSLQPCFPPALEHVVRTCLCKDPDERWQTAHDVLLQLKWICEAGSQTGLPVPVIARGRFRQNLGWLAAALCLSVLLIVLPLNIGYFHRNGSGPRAIRFSIPAPQGTTFDLPLGLSPDGRNLVFVAVSGGKNQLWVRPIDSLESRLLSGTEEATFPFWSPDSRFIGFFAEGRLKKIELSTGTVQTLAIESVPDPRGATWSQAGVILYSPNTVSPLYRIPASGGEATPATELDPSTGEMSHRWPQFLPDGQHFLYFAFTPGRENEAVYVGSLGSKDRQRILLAASEALYAPPGYLLFVRENTLMAQPFDPSKLRLTGEPIPIASGIVPEGESGPTNYAAFSVAQNGTLAYRPGAGALTQLAWFDRHGKPLGRLGSPGSYDEPELSPDGNEVVVEQDDPQLRSRDLMLVELSHGTFSRFSFHSTSAHFTPVWSPDGSRIAFSSNPSGVLNLYWKPSSGAGSEEPLLASAASKLVDSWSLDGRFLLFESQDPKTAFDLWVLPLTGDRKPWVFLQTPFNEAHASFSPDGRWVAYVSDESGRAEVYVRSFPKPTGKWQVSTEGGDQPRWRHDGHELFYLAPNQKMMAVAMIPGPAFKHGPPQAMFDIRVRRTGLTDSRAHYTVTRDGQRFLVNILAEGPNSSGIAIVVDWTAELKK